MPSKHLGFPKFDNQLRFGQFRPINGLISAILRKLSNISISEKKIYTFATLKNRIHFYQFLTMYWTLELAQHLEDAPWPATKDELIDYGIRSGAPLEVIENLQELEDEGEAYETIEEIWPDYPTKDDFFFNEDEY